MITAAGINVLQHGSYEPGCRVTLLEVTAGVSCHRPIRVAGAVVPLCGWSAVLAGCRAAVGSVFNVEAVNCNDMIAIPDCAC